MVGVDFYRGPYETKRAYQTGTRATYPICINAGSEIYHAYNVSPSNWGAVVDPDGIIHYLGNMEDLVEVQHVIEELLIDAEKPAVQFFLDQNYPNPFNGTTQIRYKIAEEAEVEIFIYDVKGREVKMLENGSRTAGTYTVYWDGRDRNEKQVSSGPYYYQVNFGSEVITKKMIYIK